MLRSLLLSIVIATNSFAQVNHSTTIGPDLGLGLNFGNASKASLGASLDHVTKFTKSVGARLFVGYNRFNSKHLEGNYSSYLPIRIGIQNFFAKDVFFIYADGGIALFKSHASEQTAPSIGIGTGYRHSLGGNHLLHFSIYFNWSKLHFDSPGEDLPRTWLNFRAAYGLSWGKK